MDSPNVETEIQPRLRGEAVALIRSAILLFDSLDDVDAWLLEQGANSATVRVVAGGALHELQGTLTEQKPGALEESEGPWVSQYSHGTFTVRDRYGLTVTRQSVSGDELHRWTFELERIPGPIIVERTYKKVGDAPADDKNKATFLLALVRGIARAAVE